MQCCNLSIPLTLYVFLLSLCFTLPLLPFLYVHVSLILPHLVLSNLILLNLIPSSLISSYLNPGAVVVARMEVLKIEERRLGLLLTCSTQVRLADGQLAVDGEAKVLLPRSKG